MKSDIRQDFLERHHDLRIYALGSVFVALGTLALSTPVSAAELTTTTTSEVSNEETTNKTPDPSLASLSEEKSSETNPKTTDLVSNSVVREIQDNQTKENVTGSTSTPVEKVNVDFVKEGQRDNLFNDNWKISKGEVKDGQDKALDDTTWESTNLPNDYSISQEASTKYEAESGFLPGGVQWYRKSFVVPSSFENKEVIVKFDGAYMNSEVYLNGQKLGEHPYGYTPFSFNLTKDLIKDGVTENVLAVKTDNPVPTSRWYSGSGIFRDVHILVTNQVHGDPEYTKIEAPDLATTYDKDVAVKVSGKVVNDSDKDQAITVSQILLDKDGKEVATSTSKALELKAGTSQDYLVDFKVPQPHLWSTEDPYLYTLRTRIQEGKEILDEYETSYGFRYFNFDVNTGFSLNGKPMKLKGVSMHHDQGALGSVQNQTAINRQVAMLKEMGANAIRSTHNPASPQLLRAANQYGMLVIDEAFDDWTQAKNGNINDYSKYFNEKIGTENQLLNSDPDMTWAEYDTKAMVHSAMNSPAVIMWSIGNEITEGLTRGADTSDYVNIAKNLISWVQSVDKTRPLTIGDNQSNNPLLDQILDEITKAGGVVGKNYKNASLMQDYHDKHPDWRLYGSETSSAIHSRGVYNTLGTDQKNLQKSEYEFNGTDAAVGWGQPASDAWYDVITKDFNAGEFVWTGFDYIGEPTPWNGTSSGSVSHQGAKPNSSYFGIIDTAGFPKDIYYLYRSLWNDHSHTLSLPSSWNLNTLAKDKDGKVYVPVYTDAAKVELYLNGKKIDQASSSVIQTPVGYQYRQFGKEFYPVFHVQFEPGTLSVKAFDDNGKDITEEAIGRKMIKTSSEPTSIVLTTTRKTILADGSDVAYITGQIVDKDGIPVPDANAHITFSVTGDGVLKGVDSGNPADASTYTNPDRDAFNGKILAIVQSTKHAGSFTVTASSDGLSSEPITITTSSTQGNDTFVQDYSLSKRYTIYKGTKLSLPETLPVSYSDGSTKEIAVRWDKTDTSTFDLGETIVTGETENEKIKPTLTVQVISPIVSVTNQSTATEVNVLPSLPTMVSTYDNTGKVSISVPVTWTINKEDFDHAGVVKVNGTANVLGTEMPVSASVRVVEPLAKEENIAPSATITNGYRTTDGKVVDKGTISLGDNLSSLNNGVNNDSDNTNERWTNWNIKDTEGLDSSYVEFTWDKPETISSLNLYLFTDSHTGLPGDGNVWLEAYNSDSKTWEKIDATNITQVSYTNGATPYGLLKPVTTTKLRINLRAQANSNHVVGLTEVEIITPAEQLKKLSTAQLEKLSVNDQKLDPTLQVQEVALPLPWKVEATAKDNASVTIVPVENKVIVVVTSEDGLTSNVLTLAPESNSEPETSNSGSNTQTNSGDHSHPTPNHETTKPDKNPKPSTSGSVLAKPIKDQLPSVEVENESHHNSDETLHSEGILAKPIEDNQKADSSSQETSKQEMISSSKESPTIKEAKPNVAPKGNVSSKATLPQTGVTINTSLLGFGTLLAAAGFVFTKKKSS